MVDCLFEALERLPIQVGSFVESVDNPMYQMEESKSNMDLVLAKQAGPKS